MREDKRSRSDAELVSKIEGGFEALEEVVYWLEILVDSGITKIEQVAELMKEAEDSLPS